MPLWSNWSYKLAFDVSVIVNTVSELLVGVPGTAVQNHDAAPQAGNHQTTFNTLSVLQIASLVNSQEESL